MVSPPPLPAGPPPPALNKPPKKKNRPSVKKHNEQDLKNKKSEEPQEKDGWEHYYDDARERYFFYNRDTKVKQWLNPRVAADDECNKNLPSTPPPSLPFEDGPQAEEPQSEYNLRLRSLKDDPEFVQLSTYEKYLRVESLKKELDIEGDELEQQSAVPTVGSTDVTPFSGGTNFHDTGSTSHFAKDLNIAIRDAQNRHGGVKVKVSKKQIMEYNARKREKKEKKLKEWLTKD